MAIHGLDQLPTEILLHIGQFVDPHPKSLVRLLPVCKTFHYTYRTILYRNIWAIVSSAEYFSRNCSTESVQEFILSNGGIQSYSQTSVITSLRSLQKLTLTLLKNPELCQLVHTFNANVLNFCPGDRTTSENLLTYMDEGHHVDCQVLERRAERLFIHEEFISEFQGQVFEASMLEFFQEPIKKASIGEYLKNKKVIDRSIDLRQRGPETGKKGILMDIHMSSMSMMLFCPHDDVKNDEFDFIGCLQSVRELLATKVKGEMAILSLQNLMTQSSFGTFDHRDELVFLSFVHYSIASK